MNGQLELRQIAVDRWLAPKEVAAHFALQEDSAYRWVNDGTIPEQYIRYCGRVRIRIHPDVIPVLEKIFAAAHE